MAFSYSHPFPSFNTVQPLALAHSESGPHECEVLGAANHRVFLLLQSDDGLVRQQRDGLRFEGVRRAGEIGIVPAGSRGYCDCQAHSQGIAVHFAPIILQEAARTVLSSERFELATRFAARDETLKNLILLLHREQKAQAGAIDPAGRLLFESLSTAFAAQLLRCHAQDRPRSGTGPEMARGLSSHAQHQVLEYIEANLAEAVSLEALAGVAGLSRYHFLRAFKTSFGLTPHQYVVQQRVEMAKRLITQRQYALREVALLSGFGDQSHLTRQFRRLTGTTPRAFGAKSGD